MKWEYFSQQGLTEQVLKSVVGGYWWTDALDGVQVQLTAKAVKYLQPSFNEAFNAGKPLTYLVTDNLRSKWRVMDSSHGKQFYISSYGNEVFTNYDSNKINGLATNSVSQYFRLAYVPTSLKRFIDGDK